MLHGRLTETSGGHLFALIGAPNASFRTRPHYIVCFGMIGAARRAFPADFHTFATEVRAVIRSTDHEIRADGANLRTIQHDLNVAGLSVSPALRKAVRDGRETASVAVEACLNACVHGVIVMLHPLDSLWR